jgi:hypothetical protein
VGTWLEWMHVLMRGAFFGAFMFIVPRWLSSRISWYKPWKNLGLAITFAIFSGIFFGLFATFELRLFQWPLSLLTIIFVFSLISVRLFWRPSH